MPLPILLVLGVYQDRKNGIALIDEKKFFMSVNIEVPM